jgi:hypothetical protein
MMTVSLHCIVVMLYTNMYIDVQMKKASKVADDNVGICLVVSCYSMPSFPQRSFRHTANGALSLAVPAKAASVWWLCCVMLQLQYGAGMMASSGMIINDVNSLLNSDCAG